MVKVTNTQAHAYCDALSRHLTCTGLLGYGIARNMHKLQDVAREYIEMYSELYAQYAVQQPDGSMLLDKNNQEAMAAFNKALEPIAFIEQEVDIFMVPMKEAIGQLTAGDMLDLDFMLIDN